MQPRLPRSSPVFRRPISAEAETFRTARPQNDLSRRQAVLGALGLLGLVAAGACGQRWIAAGAPPPPELASTGAH